MAGFIKLHRKILKWGWYKDTYTKVVFLHLLLNAAYEDMEFQGIKLKPGQLVISRRRMAKDLGIGEQSVRTALDHLQSTHEITIKVTNRFSVITVENWGKYHVDNFLGNPQSNPQSDQQLTHDQPTGNPQKRNKEGKEIKNNYYSTDSNINYLHKGENEELSTGMEGLKKNHEIAADHGKKETRKATNRGRAMAAPYSSNEFQDYLKVMRARMRKKGMRPR